MGNSETERHPVPNENPLETADRASANARTSKRRIRLRTRRSCLAEVNAKPSVAEIVVRMAAVVMLIAMCLQGIRR